MKTCFSLLIAFLFLADIAYPAAPVTEHNTWKETYLVQTPSPRLVISNIWGGVRVRAGDSGQISVSVTEFRSAPDRERLERSRETLRLDIDADERGVSMLVAESGQRRVHMDRCHGCRVDYQFEVVVPPGAILDVGTVLDGRIDIAGVYGTVSASNVNGPIRIDDVHDCESVVTVNGSVELEFSQAPVRDCRIETINGDITLDVPAGTGLDMTLDLFNGDVETELPVEPIALPATVEHTVENGHNQYRLQKMTGVRIGGGGPTYSITSMNGDVRIQ